MSVRESIVRAFLKLNIFARTPEVEESGFMTEEEALENLRQKVQNTEEWKEYQRKKDEKYNPFNF